MENYFTIQNLKEAFGDKFTTTRIKGVDNKSSKIFRSELHEECRLINRMILSNEYQFSAYKERLIIKNRFKLPRVLSIPTLRDRLVLHQLKSYLHDNFPEGISRNLPQYVVTSIARETEKEEYKYFLKTDISLFYDEIDREILLEKLEELGVNEDCLSLIQSAVENITVPRGESSSNSIDKYYRESGVPQGLSISNYLAHVYLLDFDALFENSEYYYARYVDDIIFLTKTEQEAEDLKERVVLELDKLGLTLNTEKTEIASIEDGFAFLGYVFQGNLVSIANKNIQKRINKLAAKFTWFKNGWNNNKLRPYHLRYDNLGFRKKFLDEVNSIITGFRRQGQLRSFHQYYRAINDISVLHRLDKVLSRLFSELEAFDGVKPKFTKSFVRAFYEIKYNKNTEYLTDLDLLHSTKEKKDFLASRGFIHRTKKYSTAEIDDIFLSYEAMQYNNNASFDDSYY